jgi:low affinity Fe/Cu permease
LISLRLATFAFCESVASKQAARYGGKIATKAIFGIAVFVIIGLAFCGPHFHFSDTWQLVVNTGTTIITFLMVFLIQNTQNRDARAIQLKLDEIIRAIRPANNEMIDIEKLSDQEIGALAEHYEKISAAYKERRKDAQTRIAA